MRMLYEDLVQLFFTCIDFFSHFDILLFFSQHVSRSGGSGRRALDVVVLNLAHLTPVTLAAGLLAAWLLAAADCASKAVR